MAQKKAFVRYAQNKAVPGSLIVRTKAPKVGNWKEVPYDICCEPPACSPFILELNLAYGTEPCSYGEPEWYQIKACGSQFVLTKQSDQTPAADGYYVAEIPDNLTNFYVENSVIINAFPC
jgi:hypothetical protein